MGTHVWIGKIAAEAAVGGPTPQNLPPKPELFGCFPVPWGCWWLSGQRHHRRSLIVDDPGALGVGAIGLPIELGRFFVRVWPPHERVIDWPPPVVIDRPTNEALATVFRLVDPWPVDNSPEDTT